MATSVFDQALAFVLAREGGWSDNPADPGGATMHGITLATYRIATGRPDATAAELQAIPESVISSIYRMLYWTPISGDALPADLAGPTFDAAVNSGPHRAVTWLQAALGVQADGLVGPATVARARTVNDVASVREAMLAERVIFLTGLKTFATFGTGWTRRVIGLAATHFI